MFKRMQNVYFNMAHNNAHECILCIYNYAYTCMHACVQLFTCMFMNIHMYMYVYIYIHKTGTFIKV